MTVRSFALLTFAVPLALAAAGCTTKVKPVLSKAVAEARQHRDVAVAACPPVASPVSVGFGFGDASLNELAVPALEQAGQILACHPNVAAVVVGQADGHGTDQEQQALAAARAQIVIRELANRGAPRARITAQVQGTAPAGDASHLVVLAEGRRW